MFVPATGDGENLSETFRTTLVDVCQDYDKVAKACDEQLSGVIAVSSGSGYTCALMPASRVKCWGANIAGQLGDGTALGSIFDPIVRTTPVDVCETYDEIEERCTEVFSGAAGVAAGSLHTCALATSGGLACWGANGLGQLGDGERCGLTCREPVQVCADAECSAPLSDVASLGAGLASTCAVTTAGGVKCWGSNFHGTLGDGTETRRSTPVDVIGLSSGGAAVAAGFAHACALTTAGSVQCWGTNCCGNLGIGTIDFDPHPAPLDVLAEAAKPAGDADCSGDVTSQDALLVLQLDAALIAALTCPVPMDLNGDGEVNSIDAVLILQHVAGLIPVLLPPGGAMMSQ